MTSHYRVGWYTMPAFEAWTDHLGIRPSPRVLVVA